VRIVNYYLVAGGGLSAVAALMHIGCIIFGASWYRFFGAGEKMAIMAEQGLIKPSIITSFIVIVLSIWSLYAFSAAGVIGRLPFVRLALIVITAIYLVRGVAGFYFVSNPIGRSPEFWVWSSLICLFIGFVHLIGLVQ
jgi:predicted signal transduction protein with EAL and GGDEF domain